jgi:hypothetical protein
MLNLQAKKQASIRWVMTKALAHVPKEYLIDPFKELKKVIMKYNEMKCTFF